MSLSQLERWAPLGLLVLIVGLWQLVCMVFSIPEFIFPSPLEIARALAEMTAGDSGIGYLMQSAGSQQRMALAFAGLVVIGAMAMAMYELFSYIEKHTTAWAHRGSQNEWARARAGRGPRRHPAKPVRGAASIVGIFPDGIVLGRVLENLPASAKSLGNDKAVPRLEGPAFTRVAQQPQVTLYDEAELVLPAQRAPFSRRALPDSGQEASVGALEAGSGDVRRRAFEQARCIWNAVMLRCRDIGEADDGRGCFRHVYFPGCGFAKGAAQCHAKSKVYLWHAQKIMPGPGGRTDLLR